MATPHHGKARNSATERVLVALFVTAISNNAMAKQVAQEPSNALGLDLIDGV